ncbi:hypothetical protein S0112_044 [Shewanella phage S0112]|nr:hypothetical protein S0112_044 [Shewanella phage S0112]
MKTYTAKSSAARAAKKAEGTAFNPNYLAQQEDGSWAYVKPAPKPAVSDANAVKGKSAMKGACKLVWDVAGAMLADNPDCGRKAIIEECVGRGVAYFTARTQLQRYLEACRASA